ncbi:MAG: hypothetical protein IT428_29850 [Planctomycetaceae bacterium]|nr:hypothetical protein [Planctomycetaceae bacterium]
MAEMTIRLLTDPLTGKKDILVKLSTDPDFLPQEHEELYRTLVDRLLEGGLLKAGESGRLIIEREGSPHIERAPPQTDDASERTSASQSE